MLLAQSPRAEMRTPLDLREAMLAVQDLVYQYPDHTPALNGVSLTIGAGEKVALLGPNGAGKSTLLLHLNGVLRATSGTVHVAGLPVDDRHVREVRARVGMVFQDPDDQLFSPTVFDDVAFGPLHMGVPADEIAARVERALQMVGMGGMQSRMPHHMSLGQRKRVAIATVLSMDPVLLALDEPSAGLDPRARRGLVDLLNHLPNAMLVSTHDMRMVAEVFPRTIVLSAGRVVADAATDDILADGDLLEEYGLERP